MHESKINRYAFFILLVGVTVLLFWVTRPFLLAVFWAVVLAIIFHPIDTWWSKRIRNNAASATVAFISTVLLIGVPLFFLSGVILNELQTIYTNIVSGSFLEERMQSVIEYVRTVPSIAPLEGELVLLQEKTTDLVGRAVNLLSNNIRTVGGNIVHSLLSLFVLFYTLFFLFKDGPRWKKSITQSLPLSNENAHKLANRFSSITRATIKGVFLVGIVEGIVAALIFYLTGVPTPVLWGFAVFLTSVVPGIGTGVVWFPVAAYLFLSGAYWQTVLVLISGLLVVIVMDNIIRPRMLGKDTQLPDAFILLSTFGGIIAFGMSGILLGPLIAGLFIAVWEIFRAEYKKDQEVKESLS